MEENKDQNMQNKAPQQPETKEAENIIDFSKFSLGAENHEETAPKSIFEPSGNTQGAASNITPQEQTEATNIIAELNSMQEEKKQDINIESIIIKESRPGNKESPDLGQSGEKIKVTKMAKNKIQEIMLAYIVMGISAFVILLTRVYGKYISISLSQLDTNQTLIEKVKLVSKTISEYTKINEYALRADRTDVLTNSNAEKTARDLVQSKKINYINKKDILESNMQILTQDIINNSQKLDNIKKEIIKYGFIPQQLYNIIESRQLIIGIQKRITLMQNIRIITALKAFSYMASFVDGLTNSIGKDNFLVENKLKKVVSGGENDIIIYTNTCFLNPYEITSNCSTIQDFDNYYKIIDTQKDIDTEFIKQLVSYIETKLQDTDIPTFNINFQKFNPKENKIDFTLELNTSSQDEIALNKQGILNPHVFIVTNIINLLKQSLLVIGEGIKTDQIKSSPKTIRVGSTVFTVNSSSIKLSLPIQKNIQREISDFFSSKY